MNCLCAAGLLIYVGLVVALGTGLLIYERRDRRDEPREAKRDESTPVLVPVAGDYATSYEILGRLHAVEVERFYERRKLEWRVAFTLWLAVGATGTAVLGNLPEERTCAAVLAIGVIYLVVVALHFAFEALAMVPGAEWGRAEGYLLSNIARGAIGLPRAEPLHDYRYFSAHYWLPTVTALLVLVVVLTGFLLALG